jgi:succinate dehydrogenase (ubiquinone) membrane anchor subunit
MKVTPVQKGRVFGPADDADKVVETRHWVNERLIVVALLPIIPAALAYPNPLLDNLLVASVMLHSHWRLSGVTGDYIHGAIMPKIVKPTVMLLSICALGGLLYFNYTDVGFSNAVRMIYTEL